MNIEIDQSIKIEQTNKDTVIAFSNGKSKSILIIASEKKKIQKIFREIGRSRIFVYRLFAVMVFLLIKDCLEQLHIICIDEEYSGQESLIKNMLLQEIRKIKPEFPKNAIIFQRIGKKSRAHSLAYKTAKRKQKADICVDAKTVLETMLKC